jgi:mRNA-degrading endonuclease toxin of MazEF toxin-antitoxin module
MPRTGAEKMLDYRRRKRALGLRLVRRRLNRRHPPARPAARPTARPGTSCPHGCSRARARASPRAEAARAPPGRRDPKPTAAVRPRRHEACRSVARPALVAQSEAIEAEAYDSAVVCLITASPTRGGVCRIEIAASSATGLERPSEIMVEKVAGMPRAQVGDRTGRCRDPAAGGPGAAAPTGSGVAQ